jgi:hypothetical protein
VAGMDEANNIRQQRRQSQRDVFWHYTTATDTDHISKVFNSVHAMIIMWNLRAGGVL